MVGFEAQGAVPVVPAERSDAGRISDAIDGRRLEVGDGPARRPAVGSPYRGDRPWWWAGMVGGRGDMGVRQGRGPCGCAWDSDLRKNKRSGIAYRLAHTKPFMTGGCSTWQRDYVFSRLPDCGIASWPGGERRCW